MFQLPSLRSWTLFGNDRKTEGIQIPSIEVHDIETSTEKRTRTLRHMIRANHVNHSIIYHDDQFHNHMPHILGSAYLLGADSTHLTEIYDAESQELEPWRNSPGEVSRHDWRKYLGDKRYQRAFVDFFEDELARFGYDWKKVVEEYLFEGELPLISGICGGLGHPLIHLGYAYELSNQTIAIEALALAAVGYSDFHKYLDDPSYTRPSPHPTGSLLEVLHRVQGDTRLPSFTNPGPSNIRSLFRDHEATILEHWNSWTITNPTAQFKESQRAAVLLFIGTTPLDHSAYDFFLVHLLTTSHALRILLPLIPSTLHIPLLRQWFLFTLTTYICQLRPAMHDEYITGYDVKGRDWTWADTAALTSHHRTDPHYVKAIRALKEAARMCRDDHDAEEWYLRAAIRFAEGFQTWTGF